MTWTYMMTINVCKWHENEWWWKCAYDTIKHDDDYEKYEVHNDVHVHGKSMRDVMDEANV